MPTDCAPARGQCPAQADRVSHRARPSAARSATTARRALAAEVVLADRTGGRTARRIGAKRLDFDPAADDTGAHGWRQAQVRGLAGLHCGKGQMSAAIALSNEAD